MNAAGTVQPEYLTLRQIMLFKQISSTDSLKRPTKEKQAIHYKLNE